MPAPETFEGVPEGWLVEIGGPRHCYMGSAGSMPEMGERFLFHEDGLHFYFYASRKWSDTNTYDVILSIASSRSFSGPPPYISEVDLPRVKENIKKFFSTRNFMASSRVRPPTEVFRQVIFAWTLAKQP